MNIFDYEFPDMLIKVSSKKEYLEDLRDGKIYMNESGYFRKLEDTYRGDRFDGRCPVSFDNQPDGFFEFGSVKIPLSSVKDFTVGFINDDKIPLYCCSQLSDSILIKETDTSFKFRDEFISEMEKFGGYYALFMKNEFLQNMVNHINDKQFNAKWGPVSYVDIQSEYQINIIADKDRNKLEAFFKKDSTYMWQNEWRILMASSNDKPIISKEDNHYIAQIKPLTWFHIGEISELRSGSIKLSETDDTVE